jgi:hypothetical protein
MKPEGFKNLLNTKQAAEYLGIVSPRSLEKWRKSSRPKGPKWINIEGKIGYRISDLDHFIQSCEKEPGDNFAA